MAFMAQGSGAGWHGTPLTADPAKLEIPMLHFTAAGTMSDADGSVSAAAAQHPPADPKDQVAQDVAAELEKARKGEQTPEEAFKKAVARLQRYYDEVLAPGMAAHKGYDDDARPPSSATPPRWSSAPTSAIRRRARRSTTSTRCRSCSAATACCSCWV
jgi:hypothetical protein